MADDLLPDNPLARAMLAAHAHLASSGIDVHLKLCPTYSEHGDGAMCVALVMYAPPDPSNAGLRALIEAVQIANKFQQEQLQAQLAVVNAKLPR